MMLGARALLLAAFVGFAVVTLTLTLPQLARLRNISQAPPRAANTNSPRSFAGRAIPRQDPAARPVSPLRVRATHGGVGAVTAALWGMALAMLGSLPVWHVTRRLRARRARDYRPYRLHLSMHDQAQPEDLDDMAEQIANTVRSLPDEYLRSGQRYVAFESHFGLTGAGLQWLPLVRCLADDVAQIEAAYQSAYPDVRIGRRLDEAPHPAQGTLPVPACVMRFRKSRAFIHAIVDAEREARPLLEQIANAQAALGRPSSVRLQLTPTPTWVESLARHAYLGVENRLARREAMGVGEAGLHGTLHRDELRAAGFTQNRGLLWLECVVAATSRQDCRKIAAALQARRAANHLHRRLMPVRQGLYRRRFPSAIAPLLPSLRSLISTGEAARLLELPSARMKGVPAERVALPRLPAPPQAARATDQQPLASPTGSVPATTPTGQ